VPAVSPLRIWAPAHMTFGAGGVNGNYLDSYVDAVWAEYATNPLKVFLDNNSHEYAGTTSGTTFNFTEVNLNNGAYAGPRTYTINKPSTQDLLLSAGSIHRRSQPRAHGLWDKLLRASPQLEKPGSES
jgi:Beta-1,3-glucanase